MATLNGKVEGGTTVREQNLYKPLPTLPPLSNVIINDEDTPPFNQPVWISPRMRGCTVLAGNSGLLLIAQAQGFASMMGVLVKKLNELDPQVHPFEVRFLP